MRMPHQHDQHVFAIIRFDTFQAAESPTEDTITVTKIVWDQAVAEREVARMNRINGNKECLYFWQITRLQKPLASNEQDSEHHVEETVLNVTR